MRGADVVIEAMRPGFLAKSGPRLRPAQGAQPEDRDLHDLGVRRHRSVPEPAEPRHRLRHVGRAPSSPSSTTRASPTSPTRPTSASPPGRRSAPSASSAALIRARRRRARARAWRSRSPTARRTSTGTASRPGRATTTIPTTSSPATRPTTTSGAPPGLGGMWEGVRYQFYESSDGHVLFMASEQAFWKNFCEGIGRIDLFEKWPGKTHRRPRPRQQGAADRAARHLPHPHVAGVDRLRRRAQHHDRSRQHRADHRRRPAVPGPLPVAAVRPGRRRHAALPAARRRRGAAGAHQGARGGRAHRRRCSATCSATTTPRSRRCVTPAPSADPVTERSGPLRGVRVLDLSIALTGPYAAALLADQGAEVVKVERPGIGDIAPLGRRVGQRHERALPRSATGASGRSRVDLHQPEGRRRSSLRLAADADVVVQNFRPGRRRPARPRLRRRSRAVNPDVVYASLSGFGADGPVPRPRARTTP